jgi:hypothetical protein
MLKWNCHVQLTVFSVIKDKKQWLICSLNVDFLSRCGVKFLHSYRFVGLCYSGNPDRGGA